jgi:peptidoglycan/LPS O-acetylase OafA/YrhL
MRYSAGLDGLRAVAVSAVIAFHFGVSSVFGVGVDIDGSAGVTVFFALSGYLITRLLLQEQARSGRIDLPQFWTRRLRRILPVSTLGVVAAIAVTLWKGLPSIAVQARASLLWHANWERFGSHVAYGGSTYAPLEHYWSLAVEEQFYVVLPLMMVLVFAIAGRRTLTVVFAAAAVGSAVVAQLTAGDPQAYYRTDARVVEMLAGSLLAVVATGRFADRFDRLRSGVSSAVFGHGALAVLVVCLVWSWHPHRLVVTALTVVVIATEPRLLSCRPLPQIGLISFAAYVLHPIALIAVEGDAFAALVLTAAASTASLFVVERPLRRGLPWTTVRPVLAVGLAGALFMAAAAPFEDRTVLAQSEVAPVLVTTTAPPVAGPDTSPAVGPSTGSDLASSPSDGLPAASPSSADAASTIPDRPIRISTAGDSTMQFNLAPALEAWALQDPGVEYVRAPVVQPNILGGPVGIGLEKVACGLDYATRQRSESSEGIPPEACDWTEWIPAGLEQMDLDVLIVSFGGPTAMWERLVDGEWSRPGEPEFDAHYIEIMESFEQMASGFGTRVVWLAWPDVSLPPEVKMTHPTGYVAWEDPLVVDGLAADAATRACSVDLRHMSRGATGQDGLYMDTTHFDADSAAEAVVEIAPEVIRCAGV